MSFCIEASNGHKSQAEFSGSSGKKSEDYNVKLVNPRMTFLLDLDITPRIEHDDAKPQEFAQCSDRWSKPDSATGGKVVVASQ